MATINKLSAIDSVILSDLIAVYSASNGDARKASMSVLLAFMQDNLTFSDSALTTEYASPSATDFNVQIADGSDDIHLILLPTADFADGTITLPAVGNVVDKQKVLVNCTQAVTTLVVDGNGAVAVTGEPSGLSANDFFTLKYDATMQTWYRVG
jgi:hypothetical protein